MIPRYSTPEMDAVWSDIGRLRRWLQVELLATEAQASLGIVPAECADECRRRAPQVDEGFVAAMVEREAVTNHDVAAFVDIVQQRIGFPAGSWIHHGLTSSDIVDTALMWCLHDAVTLISDAARALCRVLVSLARRHRDTVMVGRTHGMHAEPITFGAKVALWALQVDRDLRRLSALDETVSVCKLSGAVGTYSNIDPRVESMVGEAIGLVPAPATQVIARDRHAEFLWVMASIGSTMELVAVELRHLQRTEVAEVQEGFSQGQKGSSAMPHKQNPISAETISGLSRVMRSNLQAGLQDVALWHERDITHSSVERIVLPDSSQLAHYVLRRMTAVLTGLEVSVDRMRSNLEASRGLVFSQPVLLALVDAGMPRDEAYRMVQRAASVVRHEGRPFREVLDEELADMPVEVAALDRAFDLGRSIEHRDLVFTELDRLAASLDDAGSGGGS